MVPVLLLFQQSVCLGSSVSYVDEHLIAFKFLTLILDRIVANCVNTLVVCRK